MPDNIRERSERFRSNLHREPARRVFLELVEVKF